jgi:hypothetical protein
MLICQTIQPLGHEYLDPDLRKNMHGSNSLLFLQTHFTTYLAGKSGHQFESRGIAASRLAAPKGRGLERRTFLSGNRFLQVIRLGRLRTDDDPLLQNAPNSEKSKTSPRQSSSEAICITQDGVLCS